MGEEQEYVLYNKVKNAEYSRQKQEQSVRKLHGKLLERKRENAEKLKKEMLGATREEQELSYKIERERADLAKVCVFFLQIEVLFYFSFFVRIVAPGSF